MPRFTANLSLLFTERPLRERFAAARAAGFDAVEIQFPYELAISEIARELQEHALELVLINVPAGDLMQGGDGLAGIPGREQSFRHAVMQALPYAEALGVRCVNVLAGRQPADGDLLHCLHTLTANARYAAETFQSVGVTTTLEAINTVDMPRFLVHNVAQMQEILEAADHPTLKMQFDCYHLAMMGEDLEQALQDTILDIGHIQFADLPGRGAPGTGTLDYPALFRLIDELPYSGWCGAEYRPGDAGTEASLDWFRARR
ncbi:hydroxypyruvate isomerase family protein [Perlucidibaca piscinae]|uniref:hydroxypyruvate isomerase family protein n=1 Tax=Perlucidibaca piscinae TaxID=392589 RepID=UPI0003B3DC6F|nr:TIM barrel protein [Perlucidibaca piscinae]